MHLKSLKIFCDIIRLGSFSKAAELNGVSQPSASQLVHQLEERLGVQLIDRSKRPFVVTAEGALYHEGCRELVQRYADLEQAVREAHAATAGRLRVAAIYSSGMGQMHRVVEEFRSEQPEVDLHVDYMHPNQVRSAVLSGDADLGVISFPESCKELAVTPWREEPFAVAVAPSHALAAGESTTIDELAGEAFVMPQAGLRVRDEIDRWLASRRVAVEVAAEFDNLESVKRAIEVGEGIGLLPKPIFATESLAGSLAAVDVRTSDGRPDSFVRPLGVLHRRDEEPTEAVEHFLRLLRRHADDPPEPAPRPPAERSPAAEPKPAAV